MRLPFNLPSQDEQDLFRAWAQARQGFSLEEKLEFSIGGHYENYHSPLQATFLSNFWSLDEIKNFSLLMVRDGAFYLSRFFAENPTPSRCKTRLLISDDLKFLIPFHWYDNIFFYRQKVTPPVVKARDTLILSISIDSVVLGADNFKIKLDHFKNLLPSELKRVVIMFFPYNDYFFDSDHFSKRMYTSLSDSLLKLKQISDFFKQIGLEVTYTTWKDFSLDLEAPKCYFHSFPESPMYFSDSYIAHKLYGAGSSPLKKESSKECQQPVISLSSYHAIQISEAKSLPSTKQIDEEREAISEHIRSSGILNQKNSASEMIVSKESADMICDFLYRFSN